MVRQEGERTVSRNIDHYNLDAMLAVGYRMRSLPNFVVLSGAIHAGPSPYRLLGQRDSATHTRMYQRQ